MKEYWNLKVQQFMQIIDQLEDANENLEKDNEYLMAEYKKLTETNQKLSSDYEALKKELEELKQINLHNASEVLGLIMKNGITEQSNRELKEQVSESVEIIKELIYESQDLTGTFNIDNVLLKKAEDFIKECK